MKDTLMPPNDAASLLALLQRHEILPIPTLEDLRPLASQFPAAADLARELVRRGLLTPFQANEIHQGRATRLVLGQYLLLDRLGQGGMGEVFQARHRVLDRLVALKVIRPEFVNHPDAVERFRRECRAAGLLSHPNIVTVHDAHQAGDVHFLAMEFLDGKDLSRLLKERALLPPGEACDYARQAALGLQHAHEKGMVHRDVKPANLMLTAGGVVKLLDLGLARLREGADGGRANANLTQAGSIMGTPDYISPEQAAGETAGADGRADVYSLGCTLFHFLTGQPPFPGKSAREKITAHLTQPAPRVDVVRPGLHPGLADVVGRMMEKAPAARFPSAGEVAAALRLFSGASAGAAAAPAAALAAAPISSTATYVAPKPVGRISRWRRRVAAASALLTLACVVLGALLWWRPSPPPHAGAPNAGLAANKDNDPAPPVPNPPTPPPNPVAPPVIQLPPPPKHPVRDGLDWPPADCVALLGDGAGRHWGRLHAVAFRPDGKVIATADQIGQRAFIHLWDAATLKERSAWTPAGVFAMELAYSPDGKRLAAVCGDGLRLWDAGDDGLTNERKFGEPGFKPGSNLFHALFTADGQSLLAWNSAGAVRKWRLTKGDPVEDGEPNPAPPAPGPGNPMPFAISADGRTLAYLRYDKATDKHLICVTTLFDRQAAEITVELSAAAAPLALSADGKMLAAYVDFGVGGELRIWDIDGGKLKPREIVNTFSQLGSSRFVSALHFAPDGNTLVAMTAPPGRGLVGSEAWLFDATSGGVKQLSGMDGTATCLAMPLDGKALAFACTDGRLRVWDAGAGGFAARPTGPAMVGPVQRLAFRPGGAQLAIVSRLDERPDGMSDPSNLLVWDVPRGQIRLMTPAAGWFTDCAYTPDGARLFAVGTAPGKGGPMGAFREGLVRVWNADSMMEEEKPKIPDALRGLSIETLAFDHDGKTLALLGGDDFRRRAGVFDVRPFQARGEPFEVGQLIGSLALAPDGATAATVASRSAAQRVPAVKFWDLRNLAAGPPNGAEPNPPLEGPESQFARRLTFSPDGKTIAALVGGMGGPPDGRKVLLWDVATGKTRAAGRPDDKDPPHVEGFAFSADSKLLATADANGRVTVWQADKSYKSIHEWEFPGPVYSVAFDDSGSLLAVGDADGTIAVLRVPAPK